MATYIRQPNDIAYRKVNITVTANPKFTELKEAGEPGSDPDTGVVLEVLRNDGSTYLHYEGAIGLATYKVNGSDKFSMGSGLPIARLWVRKTDGTGILYKIPGNLPEAERCVEVLVPFGVHNAEIVGDKYFDKIYELKRIP